jgi:hypothetical protein
MHTSKLPPGLARSQGPPETVSIVLVFIQVSVHLESLGFVLNMTAWNGICMRVHFFVEGSPWRDNSGQKSLRYA